MKKPFNVMRHSEWDYAPRDPVTIGAAILGASATAATTVVIGGASLAVGAYVVGFVAVTAVTSIVTKALSPSPAAIGLGGSGIGSVSSGGIGGSGNGGGGDSAIGTRNRGTLVNTKVAAGPSEYVYGTVRKGGNVVFIDTSGVKNTYLHMVIAIAGSEVSAIDDIYINEKIVSINNNNMVTSKRWLNEDDEPVIRIEKYDGSQVSASPELVQETAATSKFVGKDIAYLYVRMEYDPDVFASGIPTFTALVNGVKVYDPRTQTSGFSRNAALIIRDYLIKDYGLNDSSIDEASFSSAANDCEQHVSKKNGGVQRRYNIDGVVNSTSTIGNTLQDMVQACNGTLYFSGGKWKLKVGVFDASIKTFTLDDLRSEIKLPTRASRASNFNKITGTFIDGASDFIETDYPPITSSVFLAQDGGQPNALDLPLPMIANEVRAQRVAKQVLYRAREQMVFDSDFSLSAMGVEVGDVVSLTIQDYGWSSKSFEVVSWRLKIGENGVTVGMSLRETSSAAFDWNAEERDIIRNDSTLPDYTIAPEVGLSLSAELRLVNEEVVGALLLDVTSSSEAADQFEAQYRTSGTTKFKSLGRSTSNVFEAIGVSDGYFDARARSINALGIRGRWKTITNFYATLFSAPPQDVENFSANVVGNTLHLFWTPVSDLDLSHYKVRHSSKTINASYQDAVDVILKIPRPANSATLPAQSGTYFIKAIDKTQNPSRNSAKIVVITNTANLENLNVVATITENPLFDGTTSGTAVLDDDEGRYVALDTTNVFDAASGDFDDQLGFFDGGGSDGVLATNGTYQFANYIDFGEIYVARCSVKMATVFLNYVDTFDSATGNFDAYEGDFDGDPSQFDTTSAKTQASYTFDSPAGTPVWSDWQDFIVGDITARAIRFRAVLQTSSNKTTPAIRELEATIDMPDRVESENDITYTGSTLVTYDTAFKANPAVGIAAALADGDRYVITGKSRTGFTITTYTGESVSTNSMTFDYIAKGFGREIAT